MREAKITLPKQDHSGKYMADAHSDLHNMIVEHFGGYTLTEGHGVWVNPETGERFQDEVFQYHIAMWPDMDSKCLLTTIAEYLLTSTDQHCIYVVHADGTVQFVSIKDE